MLTSQQGEMTEGDGARLVCQKDLAPPLHYGHRAIFVGAGPDRETSTSAWLFPLDGAYAAMRAVLSVVAILVGILARRDWSRVRTACRVRPPLDSLACGDKRACDLGRRR